MNDKQRATIWLAWAFRVDDKRVDLAKEQSARVWWWCDVHGRWRTQVLHGLVAGESSLPARIRADYPDRTLELDMPPADVVTTARP